MRATTRSCARPARPPLTEDSYNSRYKGAFPYDAQMTEEEAWSRYQDKLHDDLREQDMSGHSTASFVGSMTGSILSPDLVMFGFLPEAKLLNLAGNTGLKGEALVAANAARITTRGSSTTSPTPP